MTDLIAYMPLDTHPEAAPDQSILSALAFAGGLSAKLHVTTFGVDIPPVASPMGGLVIDFEGMARIAEDRSRAECARLKSLVEGAGKAAVISHAAPMGGALAAATTEARHYDVSFVPWSASDTAAQDMAQALVFDSGRPVVLVPGGAKAAPLSHIAIAWDESRVAARALGDALRLVAPGGRVTVLTVHGEKSLKDKDLAQGLAASLTERGYKSEAVELPLSGKSIAAALQDGAIAAGAQLLAMGGFGHARLRDFVLGGATKGVLADLRLPVLLSH